MTPVIENIIKHTIKVLELEWTFVNWHPIAFGDSRKVLAIAHDKPTATFLMDFFVVMLMDNNIDTGMAVQVLTELGDPEIGFNSEHPTGLYKLCVFPNITVI